MNANYLRIMLLTASAAGVLAGSRPAFGQRLLGAGKPQSSKAEVRAGKPAAAGSKAKVATTSRKKTASKRPSAGKGTAPEGAAGAVPDLKTPAPDASAAPADGTAPIDSVLLDRIGWQIGLDAAGFSPGLIDGAVGAKTTQAIKLFQQSANLPVTGRADPDTRRALGLDGREPTRMITLTDSDFAEVGLLPKTWIEKSKAARLPYPTAIAMLAERGHCSQRLLSRLNPGVKLSNVKAGDSIRIPNVEEPSNVPQAAVVEVDFGNKTIRALDASGKTLALFHCSIAAHREKRPSGPCEIKTIAMNPQYLFDPAKWPEVKDVHQKLLIPPGPRNPVGVCWIKLNMEGYGIHGTPEPEMIGKTGSHGCFRLTNWDVVRLSKMVKIGTEIRLVNSTGATRA